MQTTRGADAGTRRQPARGAPAGQRRGAEPVAQVIAKSLPPRRLLLSGAAIFAVSVATFGIFEAVFPGYRSTLDLRIYRWAGLLVRHSGDLYGTHFPHYHLLFTYTPMAALVFAVMSVVPLTALKWLFAIGGIASLAGTLWITWGSLGVPRSARRAGLTLGAAGLALWLGPVQQTLGYGQVNLVLMLIVVADLCLADGRRFQGIGIGLAAGFKLTPLIFIPYLLLTRRFRAAAVATATFALTIVGAAILLPNGSREFWRDGLFMDSHRIGNVAYAGNQSLRGALVRLIGSAPAAQPYWVVCAAVVAVGGLLLAGWAGRRGHDMAGIVLCALTGLLISPVSWSHHWVWVAPGLIVAADAIARRDWRHSAPWRRKACWLGLGVLAASFFAVPQALVPAAMAQGAGISGPWLLTGSLYVLAGSAALCLVGLCLAGTSRFELGIASDPTVS